jgi:hypothetical protein
VSNLACFPWSNSQRDMVRRQNQSIQTKPHPSIHLRQLSNTFVHAPVMTGVSDSSTSCRGCGRPAGVPCSGCGNSRRWCLWGRGWTAAHGRLGGGSGGRYCARHSRHGLWGWSTLLPCMCCGARRVMVLAWGGAAGGGGVDAAGAGSCSPRLCACFLKLQLLPLHPTRMQVMVSEAL